jgi:hypothetical protein
MRTAHSRVSSSQRRRNAGPVSILISISVSTSPFIPIHIYILMPSQPPHRTSPARVVGDSRMEVLFCSVPAVIIVIIVIIIIIIIIIITMNIVIIIPISASHTPLPVPFHRPSIPSSSRFPVPLLTSHTNHVHVHVDSVPVLLRALHSLRAHRVSSVPSIQTPALPLSLRVGRHQKRGNPISK